MKTEDIINNLDEFNKRFNITDEKTAKEEFIKFKTRIMNLLSGIDEEYTDVSISNFCLILGIEENWRGGGFGVGYNSNMIIDQLRKEYSEIQFYKLLQILFYLELKIEEDPDCNSSDFTKTDLYDCIIEALSFSKVNLSISKVGKNKYVLYPKGEKELDEKLVNLVLSFLNPLSNTLFTEGLTSYLEGTDRSFIDAVDKMRRTIEEFLRFKLKNKKGLKENISEINKIHKADDKDVQIRKIISAVFSYLDEYFNENAKHKDGDINDNECEYIIYQTGVLLRYIIRLV
jgi:hypothetical protein